MPARSLPSLRMALVAATALAGNAAQAMTVDYLCTGYRPLSAEFTPRVGQLHFEGRDWTLARVRDAREARYVNGAAAITVVAKVRGLEFTHGGETLQCVLKSDALTPTKPYVAPRAASQVTPAN